MTETRTIYRTWYRDTKQGIWRLWCETSDPNDSYLIPTPDVTTRVRYDVLTITQQEPIVDTRTWQPSPELLAKGHPSTWEDE